MQSVGMNDIGSALLITAGFTVVSIIVVVLAMWWVFAFFKDKKNKSEIKKETIKNPSQNSQE